MYFALSFGAIFGTFRNVQNMLCFHTFWRARPPDHSVRNVWRASSVRSIPRLGLHIRHLGRQDRSQIAERPRPIGIHAAKVATECPKPGYNTSPRELSEIQVGVFRWRVRHAYEAA